MVCKVAISIHFLVNLLIFSQFVWFLNEIVRKKSRISKVFEILFSGSKCYSFDLKFVIRKSVGITIMKLKLLKFSHFNNYFNCAIYRKNRKGCNKVPASNFTSGK